MARKKWVTVCLLLLAMYALMKPGVVLTPAWHPDVFKSAVSQLGCLASPGCWALVNCHEGGQPRMFSHDFESQAFCAQDLRKSRCIIYSFGVFKSLAWEIKVAHDLKCEVHAFDPNEDWPLRQALPKGVFFHQWGLEEEGYNVSSHHSSQYSATSRDKVKPLNEIMKQLHHLDYGVDVIKLDCEGCEWGAIQTICDMKVPPRQLMVEFHFQKNLGLNTASDVMQAARSVECLRRKNYHMVSSELSGAGIEDWSIHPLVGEALPKQHGRLLYATFRHFSDGEHTPGSATTLVNNAAAALSIQRKAAMKRAGVFDLPDHRIMSLTPQTFKLFGNGAQLKELKGLVEQHRHAERVYRSVFRL